MKYHKLQKFANQLVEYVAQGLEQNQVDQSNAVYILSKITMLLKTFADQECNNKLNIFDDQDWMIIQDFVRKI